MSKLNLYDLCGVLVSKNGLEDKEARRFVQAVFDIIQEGLDEDKIVKVKGLGTFKIIDVDARESINVNTGGRVLIEGHSKVTFTPDSVMKEIVNKPFSQFETVVLNDGVDFPETQEDEVSGEAEESNVAPAAPVEEDKHAAPAVENKPATPAVEDKPEPVVENMSESIMEPTPSDEKKSEPMAEALSAVEAAPVVEHSSSVEPVSEKPASEETASEESGPDVDENVSETDEEEEKSPYRWLMYCAAVILLVVAAAYGGYLYGKYEMSEDIAHKQMLADLKAAEETTKKAAAESIKDTAAQTVDATKIGAISTEKLKQDSKNEEKANDKTIADEKKTDEVKKQQPDATDDSKKYEDKDVRVRTGAYRIVGLDKTVKARAGQTVEDIANRNLGSGMSCYVEVYNDLKGKTVLKEGQAINIPKLQLKKRR